MSAIDVLAVMDFEIEGWDAGSKPYEELSEARAAVAELIEALQIARKQMAHRGCGRVRPTSEWEKHGSMNFDNCQCDIRRVDTALSRVRGAA